MTTVEVFAPAKINLTLHITGRRDDGYHLLDSLVAFAPVGDRLAMTASDTSALVVEGPEARGVPGGMENLALRAATLVRGAGGVSITLTKTLPAASGIGGGSADAAAAVRGALALAGDADTPDASGHGIFRDTLLGPLAALGADIPMCLVAAPCRARGIGERIGRAQLPPLPAVLANPRVPVSTPAVFGALAGRENPGMAEVLPVFADAAGAIDWLASCRNDLQSAAISVAPAIGRTLEALARLEGARLVRMSGSGATCFALFEDAAAAHAAAARLGRERPDWWVADGLLGDQSARAMPRLLA